MFARVEAVLRTVARAHRESCTSMSSPAAAPQAALWPVMRPCGENCPSSGLTTTTTTPTLGKLEKGRCGLFASSVLTRDFPALSDYIDMACRGRGWPVATLTSQSPQLTHDGVGNHWLSSQLGVCGCAAIAYPLLSQAVQAFAKCLPP